MKYLLAYILPVSCLLALLFGGLLVFIVPSLSFIVIPLLELFLVGKPGRTTPKFKLADKLYTAIVYGHVPFLYLLLYLYFEGVSISRFTTYEFIGLTLSMGIILGTFGMNLGHELGHRQGWFNQLCAHLLWLPNLYMHFGIEHNLWHHKYVATDDDPASAPRGMSLYRFWWTSVTGNLHTAWKVEKMRLSRGESGVPFNRVLLYLLIECTYLLVIFLLFGLQPFFSAIFIGVFGLLLLETVNYIEHYGLRRKRLANGRWEPQGPEHSWNSEHELGRIILYELTRHPDHHLNTHKHYQELEGLARSPQLPYGYPGSILLALVPSIWMSVMHRALDEYGT